MRRVDEVRLLSLASLVLVGCESPGVSNAAGEWRLSDDPLIAIGLAESDPEYQFHQIAGVVRFADARIAVADAGSQQIRIFDGEGRHVRTLGGPGDGPGEFRTLASMDHHHGDSLLVFDSGRSRVSVFHPDEGFTRSWTLESLGRGLFPSHAFSLSDGSVLVAHLRGNMPGDPAGVIRNTAPLVRYSSAGVPMNDVAELPGDEWYRWEDGQRSGLMYLPFGKRGHVAIQGSTVYVGDGQAVEFRAFDADGDFLGTVERPVDPTPVTPEDIRRFESARLLDVTEPTARQAAERRHSEIPYPETMPAYGSLVADRSGNLWVEEYQPDPETPARWTVMDQDGAVLAVQVEMPLRFRPYWIEEELVLGVIRDELDVEYVHGYRLFR